MFTTKKLQRRSQSRQVQPALIAGVQAPSVTAPYVHGAWDVACGLRPQLRRNVWPVATAVGAVSASEPKMNRVGNAEVEARKMKPENIRLKAARACTVTVDHFPNGSPIAPCATERVRSGVACGGDSDGSGSSGPS